MQCRRNRAQQAADRRQERARMPGPFETGKRPRGDRSECGTKKGVRRSGLDAGRSGAMKCEETAREIDEANFSRQRGLGV
eukprot:6204501-Pleurochrysis_carterae.AAC.1